VLNIPYCVDHEHGTGIDSKLGLLKPHPFSGAARRLSCTSLYGWTQCMMLYQNTVGESLHTPPINVFFFFFFFSPLVITKLGPLSSSCFLHVLPLLRGISLAGSAKVQQGADPIPRDLRTAAESLGGVPKCRPSTRHCSGSGPRHDFCSLPTRSALNRET